MTWERYADYSLYGLVVILTLVMSHGGNLLFQMISIDGIFNAIHFFKKFIDHKVSEEEIMKKKDSIYQCSILDRYIYYFISFVLYNTLCNFFWIKWIRVIYYGFLLTMLPPILNRITQCSLFEQIRKKKEQMVKTIVSKQLTGLIESISKTYLKKDIKIHHSELLPLFDNYTNTLNYSIDIIYNILLVFLTIYVKKYSTSFYYNMLKYIYNYKTGVELESFNERMAKIKLTTIMEERKWKELLNPNMCKAIVHLYQLNNDEVTIFNEMMNSFYYSLGKMFAIWSVSSFFNQVLIGPIVSIFMIFYRNQREHLINRENIEQLGVVVVSGIVGYFTGSFFLTSFICQFGYHLVFNNVVATIVKSAKKEAIEKFNQLNAINSGYIIPIITTSVFMSTLGFVFNYNAMIIMLMEAVRKIIVNNDHKRTMIYCILLFTGLMSSFNPIHILHNAIIIYIVMAIVDLYTSDKILLETKLIINRWHAELINKKKMLTGSMIQYYDEFRDALKRWIRNFNSPNYQKIRFEMLDTDLFPSVSQKVSCEKTKDDITRLGNHLNDQQVINIIRPNAVEINNNLFMLGDDDFVEAISVGSNDRFCSNAVDESIVIDSIEPSATTTIERDFDARTEVIEDYCTSH